MIPAERRDSASGSFPRQRREFKRSLEATGMPFSSGGLAAGPYGAEPPHRSGRLAQFLPRIASFQWIAAQFRSEAPACRISRRIIYLYNTFIHLAEREAERLCPCGEALTIPQRPLSRLLYWQAPLCPSRWPDRGRLERGKFRFTENCGRPENFATPPCPRRFNPLLRVAGGWRRSDPI